MMNPDDLYAALVDMHRGLTGEQSMLVNSRLILLLAERIEDEAALREAIAAARAGIVSAEPGQADGG